MVGIDRNELLMAASVRQGMKLEFIEAVVINSVLEKEGISLVFEADWSMKEHYSRYGSMHDNDFDTSLRDVIALAADINKENIDSYDGDEDDQLLSLYKDQFILGDLMKRAQKYTSPVLKKFRINVAKTDILPVDIEAASWTEARCIAEKNYEAGLYHFEEATFEGVSFY